MSRHANAGRKLSRNTSHRKALLDNLVRAVILNESIRTTTPKAKEARRLVERVITKARDNTLASRRVVHKTVRDQAALAKLFENIGPRFKERPGGYTRIVHVQNRLGDNAPMSILELVVKGEKTEPEQKPAAEKKAEKKAAAKETGGQGAGEKKPAKQKKAKKEKEEKGE
ncbi:MAG: 50S ribosomal protein L17 [Deltaproteobacteria bacterium]|nr:MAG: 50S ribosomal protein L17 [Deltaproteobacteria bacterium]TMA41929.1 MAG: 50S ribosomal protein L17 [Deltaproteobacteria bacterium]TMA74821.1 MAG: 50S ribosomal protein L17 [Deltaproteobacteria bacterium]TMB33034.1 MAG: 50S ribosomal protein L17 [Deltaproteobacteria bacterium]